MKYFKLVYPSALDPAGIEMLRSITDLFSMAQIDLNTINFKIEKIDDLVKDRAQNFNFGFIDIPKSCMQ